MERGFSEKAQSKHGHPMPDTRNFNTGTAYDSHCTGSRLSADRGRQEWGHSVLSHKTEVLLPENQFSHARVRVHSRNASGVPTGRHMESHEKRSTLNGVRRPGVNKVCEHTCGCSFASACMSTHFNSETDLVTYCRSVGFNTGVAVKQPFTLYHLS